MKFVLRFINNAYYDPDIDDFKHYKMSKPYTYRCLYDVFRDLERDLNKKYKESDGFEIHIIKSKNKNEIN